MLIDWDWLLLWVPHVPCILSFSVKYTFFPPLALCDDGRAEIKCNKLKLKLVKV